MTKSPKKSRLTDAERHKRFKEMARELAAKDDPESFEAAFASVVAPPKSQPKT